MIRDLEDTGCNKCIKVTKTGSYNDLAIGWRPRFPYNQGPNYGHLHFLVEGDLWTLSATFLLHGRNDSYLPVSKPF